MRARQVDRDLSGNELNRQGDRDLSGIIIYDNLGIEVVYQFGVVNIGGGKPAR